MQQLLGISSKALERQLAVTEYVFDENNDDFSPKSDEYNEFFIKQVGVRFNDLLRYRGFVFLNDILKALEITNDQGTMGLKLVSQITCRDITQGQA